VGDALLGADERDDLGGRVQLHAEAFRAPLRGRVPEDVGAGIGRVLVGLRLMDRLAQRLYYVVGGRRIRVADAQVYDIDSLSDLLLLGPVHLGEEVGRQRRYPACIRNHRKMTLL
jgi:hypothetical protein